MPSSATKKTGSAPRRRARLLLAAGCLALAVALLCLAPFFDHNPGGYEQAEIGGFVYKLQVAATPAARAIGLSTHRSLGLHEGMLFIYPVPGDQCFWMKNMHFSIDIIWLDHIHRVVHVLSNVSPATYPKSFCPPVPAQYVIELHAGQAAQDDVRSGTLLDW
ncbi:MAG TPA: DUF192 domain-containing protein [Candidatus Saccharimonadales bacterium]|nr:DUF192 domain-containing protein [Candidatus Saccharimonadales bacterium]